MDGLGQRLKAAPTLTGYPPPTTFAEDLERCLLIMLTAHEHLGIESLTPHEISKALLDGFRIDIPRQRVQSLLEGNKELALRRTVSGKRKYQILHAGERRVKSVKSMDFLFIQPESALTSVRQVQDLMSARTGVVRLCDPYLAPRSLDYLSQLTSSSGVHVLTQQIDMENSLKRDLKPLVLQLGISVEIRRVAKRVLHDRYLIDDADMFILGTSLNGIGLKQSMVVRTGPDLRSTVLSEFQELWQSATLV